MLLYCIAFIACVVTFAADTASAAGKRVALVIGNSAYMHTSKLVNPRNDAEDITAVLEGLGISVIEGRDLDKSKMDRKVQEFAEALAGADLGLFFYAGHGLQVNGVNYLVPTDAKLSTEHALDFEMVRLDLVQRVMERATQTNVIFLDACRDNPLARNLTRAMGTRSTAIGKGLANVEAGLGTLISYATHPGAVAADGDGRNSPYSAALKERLATPCLTKTANTEISQSTQRRHATPGHHRLEQVVTLRRNQRSPSPECARQPLALHGPRECARNDGLDVIRGD